MADAPGDLLLAVVTGYVDGILEVRLPELAAKLRPYLVGAAQPELTMEAHLPAFPYSGGRITTTMWRKYDEHDSAADHDCLAELANKVKELEADVQSCKASQNSLEKSLRGLQRAGFRSNAVAQLSTKRLRLRGKLVHDEGACSCPSWAASFYNVQDRLEVLYWQFLLKNETDDELLVRLFRQIVKGVVCVKDMQDLMMWKLCIRAGSLVRKDLSGALKAFMEEHGLLDHREIVQKMLVAAHKLKEQLLYGGQLCCLYLQQPRSAKVRRNVQMPASSQLFGKGWNVKSGDRWQARVAAHEVGLESDHEIRNMQRSVSPSGDRWQARVAAHEVGLDSDHEIRNLQRSISMPDLQHRDFFRDWPDLQMS